MRIKHKVAIHTKYKLYSKQQNTLIVVAKLLFKMKSTQVLALSTYYGVSLQNNVLYFTYVHVLSV